MLNNMAKSNVWRNNVFVNRRGPVQLLAIRCEDHSFEGNAVHASEEISFIVNDGAITKTKDNLLYSGSGRLERVLVDNETYGRSSPMPLDVQQ